MADVAQQIRKHLELIETDQDLWIALGPWDDDVRGMHTALLAVLDRHKPIHYGGTVQYEYRDEPVFSADGTSRGTVQLRGDALPPDWCEPCSDVQPCDEIRDIAKALGIEVDRG